jgi:hypothetical protein
MPTTALKPRNPFGPSELWQPRNDDAVVAEPESNPRRPHFDFSKISIHPPESGQLQAKPDSSKASAPTDAPAALGDAARLGTSGAGHSLPHLETIQKSFGKYDVSTIAAHTDQAASAGTHAMGANAFAMGDHVAFAAAPSLQTTAHEAAHAIQQRAGVRLEGGVGRAGDPHERHADAVAARVVAGYSSEALLDAYMGARGAEARSSSGGNLAVQRQQPTPMPAGRYDGLAPGPTRNPAPDPAFAGIVTQPTISALTAEAAFQRYQQLAPSTRRAVFEWHYPPGHIERLLKALPADRAATVYVNEVRELLRWVQERATRAQSGQSDEQMADTQKTFMEAKATAAARAAAAAAAPPGSAPPAVTPAQVAEAHAKNVAQNSIAPTPATVKKYPADYTAAEVSQWEADAKSVVPAMVAYAQANYPALKLTAANLKIDYAGVQGRGQNVLAYHEDGPPQRAVGGFAFVTAAKVNPKYMIEVVVHEAFGHSEIEGLTSSYGLSIYDKAAAKMPGARPARQQEFDSFGYHESEIYSILRALPYHQTVDPGDAGKNFFKLADPKNEVDRYVQKIIAEWEPTLAAALVRGLYERLRLDNRITPPALEAFREVIRARFALADSAKILR